MSKLNMALSIVITLLLISNTYMDAIEHEALNKRLDDKTLLCIKTGEIKSRHNIILDCSEVK